MSEIDYAELDKKVTKAMANDNGAGSVPNAKKNLKKLEINNRPNRVQGRYMDLVHPSSDMRPPARDYSTGKKIEAPKNTRLERKEAPKKLDMPTTEELEFGLIEDVTRNRKPTKAELIAEEDFISEPEPLKEEVVKESPKKDKEAKEVPNANNYSLGGRSPFIPDAKVEKRPLSSDVPENSVRSVNSTRNVYSQRSVANAARTNTEPIIIEEKKKSGWMWAIGTLLVIAIGGGLGALAFFIYSNQ